jgi:hypothetical protein
LKKIAIIMDEIDRWVIQWGQGTRIKIVEIDVGYKPIVEQHCFERVRKLHFHSTTTHIAFMLLSQSLDEKIVE